MNANDHLDLAVKLLERCGDDNEALLQQARKNFIVNLVTILEVHMRQTALQDFGDTLLDGAFVLNVLLSGTAHNWSKIHELVDCRNQIVHEGYNNIISSKQVEEYYRAATAIILHKL